MVSIGERRELYNYSRLSGGDVVEFGTFFGSSTGALASGLVKRSESISHSKVYAYDAFESEISHGFTRHVFERAKVYGLSHYIETDEKKVS
jgi:predicted O-methyltransferase YrrM